MSEFLGMRGYPISPSQERNILRDRLAQEEYGMNWDELASPSGPGKLAQEKLTREVPELQELTNVAEEAFAEKAVGEGKVWSEWHAEGRAVEERFQNAVLLATDEVRTTGDGVTFREKVESASDIRRAMYTERVNRSRFKGMKDYFSETIDADKLAEMNIYDVARMDYYNLLYSDDMYDSFGNYDFGKAEEREQGFIQQYGTEAMDYIKEYMGAKWDAPDEMLELQKAREVLRPYWGIRDIVARLFGERFANSPKGKSLISKRRKLMRLLDPELDRLYNLFYSRGT